MKRTFWAGLAATVLLPMVVWGADLMLPFTFSAGGRVRAAELNANFEALRNEVNRLNREAVALRGEVDALRARSSNGDGGLPLRLVTSGVQYDASRAVLRLTSPELVGRMPLVVICRGTYSSSGAYSVTYEEMVQSWFPPYPYSVAFDGGASELRFGSSGRDLSTVTTCRALVSQ